MRHLVLFVPRLLCVVVCTAVIVALSPLIALVCHDHD